MARVQRSEPLHLNQAPAKPLSEIATAGIEIEPMTGSLRTDAVELEMFMNETVVIRILESDKPGALQVITPNVNGLNQPIVRNQDVPVKRKYVEALLRSHTINYDQRIQNPSEPANIQMIAKPVTDYPFEVVEDTAKGRSWMKEIKRQVYQEVARA